jgi:uncharacterized SAM-binding protein YcdF (DUF218 family)
MRKGLKKFVRIFIYVHVFLAAAMLLTHCTFKRYAEKSYARAKKEKPFDVIIVPGVPYEKENTTMVMKMRIYWAKHLYDSGYTRNIIFSGAAVYSPFVEGLAMKTIADSLGIPREHLYAETKAEHSTENIYYSWKLAKELGFKKIALATDPYQSGLLRSFTRRYCPGVKAIPIVFGMMDIGSKTLPVIDTTSCHSQEFVSILEREGFWQRFRGTMGKRVKEARKEELRKQKEAAQESVSQTTY